MAKFISVVSGKGGTGKSTVSASLALSLAAIGSRVLVADLDAGLRSMDILLEVENKIVFDLGDVLEGKCGIPEAIVSNGHHRNCCLLCAPMDADKNLDTPEVTALLRAAAADFDYVVLDLPAGLGLSVRMSRELADLVAVVTVPDIITMRDTRKTVDALLSGCQKPCRLIINKVGREAMLAGGLSDLDEMLDTVGIQLFAVVPWDPYINTQSFSSRPGGRRKPLTQKVFDAMAQRVAGKYVPILVKTV